MIITVDTEHLLWLLNDLNGWQNVEIRSLTEAKQYNVHLSRKQVAKLGSQTIRNTYESGKRGPSK